MKKKEADSLIGVLGLAWWVLLHPALMLVAWRLAVVPLMGSGGWLDSYLAFVVLTFMVRATVPQNDCKHTNIVLIDGKVVKDALKQDAKEAAEKAAEKVGGTD